MPISAADVLTTMHGKRIISVSGQLQRIDYIKNKNISDQTAEGM
jgi:hypothetical protein